MSNNINWNPIFLYAIAPPILNAVLSMNLLDSILAFNPNIVKPAPIVAEFNWNYDLLIDILCGVLDNSVFNSVIFANTLFIGKSDTNSVRTSSLVNVRHP